MSPTMKAAALGALAFALLDGVWLGLLMNNFYRDRLAPIARLSPSGGFAPNWTAALLVYVCLGAGLAIFVMPRAATPAAAAVSGAVFGLIVYGVYDLTNVSTLRQYPLMLAIADIAWGSAASAVAAAVMRAAIR